MKHLKTWAGLGCVCALASGSSIRDQPPYTVTALSLSIANTSNQRHNFTTPNGINDSGSIVGSYLDNFNVQHGFLLIGSTGTQLDVPFGSSTIASGLNNLGQIVGNYVGADGRNHGFIRSPAGQYTSVDAPFPATTLTVLNGINNAGSIVGTCISSGVQHGFVVTMAGFSLIDVPAGISTRAFGINSFGQVVGSYLGPDGIAHGFMDDAGQFTTIDLPGASTLTVLAGINDSRQIAGFADRSGGVYTSRLFLAIPGAIATDPIGAFPIGINTTGTVVGFSGGAHTAFIAIPSATRLRMPLPAGHSFM